MFGDQLATEQTALTDTHTREAAVPVAEHEGQCGRPFAVEYLIKGLLNRQEEDDSLFSH